MNECLNKNKQTKIFKKLKKNFFFAKINLTFFKYKFILKFLVFIWNLKKKEKDLSFVKLETNKKKYPLILK